MLTENSYPAMLLQLAYKIASVVSSVKCICSKFRLLVAVHIKAKKMCSGISESKLSQVSILIILCLISVGTPIV